MATKINDKIKIIKNYQNKKETHRMVRLCIFIGTPGRIRTCGQPLRRRSLYPAELRGRPVMLRASRPVALLPVTAAPLGSTTRRLRDTKLGEARDGRARMTPVTVS